MEVEQLTLTPPSIEGKGQSRGDHGVFTLWEGSVRAVDRSRQLLVIEMPKRSNASTENAGLVPGTAITVRTADGHVYEGYIEVIAEAASGWICWCGLDFDG